MLNHSWDSPRNYHLDVPKLVLVQGTSMYWELTPSEGQSQCRSTIPAFISIFFVFCYSNERVSLISVSGFKLTAGSINISTHALSQHHCQPSGPEIILKQFNAVRIR